MRKARLIPVLAATLLVACSSMDSLKGRVVGTVGAVDPVTGEVSSQPALVLPQNIEVSTETGVAAGALLALLVWRRDRQDEQAVVKAVPYDPIEHCVGSVQRICAISGAPCTTTRLSAPRPCVTTTVAASKDRYCTGWGM